MAGRFEVFRDNKGEFRFRFKARNGEIMMQSQGYTSKAACFRGISIIKENAPLADIIEE